MNNKVIQLLASINGGYNSHAHKIDIIWTKKNEKLLLLLQKEGFIESFFIKEIKNKRRIWIYLKMNKWSFSATEDYQSTHFDVSLKETAKIIQPYRKLIINSTPGKKIFKSLKWLEENDQWHTIYILSTDREFITNKEALLNKIGGSLICTFYL